MLALAGFLAGCSGSGGGGSGAGGSVEQWWSGHGQSLMQSVNQDVGQIHSDSQYDPAALPADGRQLVSDVRAAQADSPPEDKSDYQAYLSALANLALTEESGDGDGPLTMAWQNAQQGNRAMAGFGNMLACHGIALDGSMGSCSTPGSDGNGAAPSQSPSLDGPPSAAGGQPAPSPASSTAAADEQEAQSDLSTVQGISLQNDLGTLNKDVQVTRNDAGALKTDVASALADSCGNGLGSATNQDQTALFGTADQGPGGDESTDATDANTLQNNITTARSQVTALQNDLATLKADGASAPSGAQAAITAARSTISQEVSTGNADIGQENGLLSQAYQAVMSLTQNSGCAGLFNMLGSGSITQPASIPHVS